VSALADLGRKLDAEARIRRARWLTRAKGTTLGCLFLAAIVAALLGLAGAAVHYGDKVWP
jgi:hypothetical protein